MRIVDDNLDDLPENLDYFFLVAGVDNRAYKVLRDLKNSEVVIKHIIVIDFIERRNGDRKYLAEYYQYKTIFANIITVDANIHESSKFVKDISSRGFHFEKTSKIGVDISCFTKPYIFSFFKFIQKGIQVDSIYVFYTEPKSYRFENGFCKTYKSSKGPIRVEELPSYTGYNLPDRDRLLVVLLGFDGDLSKEINEEISPKKTVLINGFPGYSPKFKDISLINNELLINNPNNIVKYCKANNPFEVYNTLDKLCAEYSKENDFFVNVAPIGSKPMALGVCLYAIHNPFIRIIYPMPENYNNDSTTSEIWHSLMYIIPLTL